MGLCEFEASLDVHSESQTIPDAQQELVSNETRTLKHLFWEEPLESTPRA